MKCIWITDEDKVKGFKCEFSPVDMLIVVSGLKYITADIERHPKDRERAQGIYNQIMLCRYNDEADRKTEPQTEHGFSTKSMCSTKLFETEPQTETEAD